MIRLWSSEEVCREFDKENFAGVHDVGKVKPGLTLADNMLECMDGSKGPRRRERGLQFPCADRLGGNWSNSLCQKRTTSG